MQREQFIKEIEGLGLTNVGGDTWKWRSAEFKIRVDINAPSRVVIRKKNPRKVRGEVVWIQEWSFDWPLKSITIATIEALGNLTRGVEQIEIPKD